MIRILIENILLFLLPSGVYLLYVLVQRRMAGTGETSTRVIDDAPLLWLFLAGVVTVVATLAAFGSNTGGKPGEAYEPPSIQNGRIVPGHQGTAGDHNPQATPK